MSTLPKRGLAANGAAGAGGGGERSMGSAGCWAAEGAETGAAGGGDAARSRLSFWAPALEGGGLNAGEPGGGLVAEEGGAAPPAMRSMLALVIRGSISGRRVASTWIFSSRLWPGTPWK